MRLMTDETKKALSSLHEIAYKLAIWMIAGLSAWTLSSLSDVKADIAVLNERTATMQVQLGAVTSLEERVRLIESDRFTEDDGKRLEDIVDSIKSELALIRGRLPDSFPPSTTEKRLEAIEARLHELEKK